MMGGVELEPRAGAPGARGLEIHKRCFWDEKLVVRNAMDIVCFSPFLNAELDDLERACTAIHRVVDTVE